MWLFLDIGNSRLKAAWCNGRDFVSHQVWTYEPTAIEPCLEQLSLTANLKGVYIASVAGDTVNQTLKAWFWRHGFMATFFVSEYQSHGVRNGYHLPETLGVDRWLAILAAYSRYTTAVCVVDCGTAMTIDLLNGQGQHLGGMILPGLAIQASALEQHLAKVKLGDLAADGVLSSPWGQDTASCIAAGRMAGLVGAVEFAMQHATPLLGAAPRLLLTGGGASDLIPWLERPYDHREHLVLEGMLLMVEEIGRDA